MQKYLYLHIKFGKQMYQHECSDGIFDGYEQFRAILHVHTDPRTVGCLALVPSDLLMPGLWPQALGSTEHSHSRWWQGWQHSAGHQGLEITLRHVHRGPCTQLLRLAFVMVNVQKITTCDRIPTSG